MSTLLPALSMPLQKAHDWWIPPKPRPVSLIERVWLAACRAVYTVVDALDRIRSTSDGLDKTLKLFVSLAVGMMMVPYASRSYWDWLQREMKNIDGVFSAVSVFGRYNALMELDPKTGKRAILKRSEAKIASVGFLAVAKTFEFGKLLTSVGLLSTDWLVNMDVRYLGGVVAKIGGDSVLGRVAFQAGLQGCKNFFLVLSSSFGIVDSSTTIYNWKWDNEDRFELKRAGLSIGADLGKIYLATAAFAVAPIWVLVAFLTAVFSLGKILLESYRNSGESKKINYPNWMRV